MPTTSDYRRTISELSRIAARHIFLPINAIIFSVVILLVLFGNAQEGLFLGAIVLVNIALGFAQDARAWFMLERLQLLTAPRITRIDADGSENAILLHDIMRGDALKLTLGDQVPCDGTIVSHTSMEVNEGLITGESDSLPRSEGDTVLGGSVVTSGHGIMRADTPFSESRMAQMAAGLKRYSANPSPIQLSIGRIIRVTIYVLLVSIAIVVVRGALLGETELRIVENIGALASILVPQGLVVSVTLLFTFGAAHFYNRNVLLQEVNATEKFGHIKNLCMDKTGTLTENSLTVERMETPIGVHRDQALSLSGAYVAHSGDSSQAMRSIAAFLEKGYAGEAFDSLSFSSWRQYGGVVIKEDKELVGVLAGAPEVFLSEIPHAEEAWLNDLLLESTRAGKHVLAIVRTHVSTDGKVPHTLKGASCSIVAVFILSHKLRAGIRDTIDFFQGRGITIRILSGDNLETVRAIASSAGIEGTDAYITGPDMENWGAAEYEQLSSRYRIFARIKPEQKERIVAALKKDGFTAMVGDGANDALSLKKADLGIAMFDGAQAARQVAAVVLMHNSFVELPAGVRLADSMIENIEIFTSIFLNQTFVAFLLFLSLTVTGYDFPLNPLNISLISYFAVGLPGMLISYWAIRPRLKTVPIGMGSFFERVLPVPIALSGVELIVAACIFAWAERYSPSSVAPLLVIGFAILGFLYFTLAPRAHSGALTSTQRIQIGILGIAEGVVLYAAFNIPLIAHFFHVSPPAASGVLFAAVCAGIGWLVMTLAARALRSPTNPSQALKKQPV